MCFNFFFVIDTFTVCMLTSYLLVRSFSGTKCFRSGTLYFPIGLNFFFSIQDKFFLFLFFVLGRFENRFGGVGLGGLGISGISGLGIGGIGGIGVVVPCIGIFSIFSFAFEIRHRFT